MTKKVREIEAALSKKGFRQDATHHLYWHFFLDGKKTTVNTFFSHGATEIYGGRINQQARQLNLSKKQFLEFIECRLDEAAYQKILLDGGHIERDQP